MTIIPPTQIQLIPWDPNSEEHINRLILQRLACGWGAENVRETWCKQQQEGHKSLHWIVLKPTPQTPLQLTTHLTSFPQESTPLPYPTSPNTPHSSHPRSEEHSSFIPIGHISLDADEADPPGKLSYDLQNVFRITAFYISKPLQGLKVGSLAMDEVERMAKGRGRKALVLSTAADEYPGREGRFVAMGKTLPVHSVSKWYARRGYELYKTVEEAWFDVDSTGKTWHISAVFMKKDIGGEL
ncbi:hypothetical protein HYFRA_00000490 [Hymenoscyphus fraxineus]|uniref:N-acetyltransferase domain-containing protein n=1 Tax=Hymenoscyphus fraxineus TaxID=746836 RepID=A0A9N9L5X9_9HELO|nr:hypothetical protein HYFRA_00000490 [Hymenoscyphus fraxineus]